MAARVAADVITLGDRDLAVLDEARLRRRAAHVERDQILVAESRADLRRRDHAADGAGLHHRDRQRPRRVRRHHAAVRLHDQEAPGERVRFEPLAHAADVAARLRADVGVHHGRGRALVLAVFAHDLVRERHVGASERGAQDAPHLDFVNGVDVRMQEADCDCLGSRLAHGGRDGLRLAAVERDELLAARAETLVHLEGAGARHERRGPLEAEVVSLRPVLPADLVDVARAARDDERRLRALLLDRDVDRDRRAVNDVRRRRGLDRALTQTVPHALRQIARRRERLALSDPAGALVERDEVGERAADVDGDTQVTQRPLPQPLWLRRRRESFGLWSCLAAADGPTLSAARMGHKLGLSTPDRSVRLQAKCSLGPAVALLRSCCGPATNRK